MFNDTSRFAFVTEHIAVTSMLQTAFFKIRSQINSPVYILLHITSVGLLSLSFSDDTPLSEINHKKDKYVKLKV